MTEEKINSVTNISNMLAIAGLKVAIWLSAIFNQTCDESQYY